MWAWLARVFGESPSCRVARQRFRDQHPDWTVAWTSVRAREERRDVVAVFYQVPPALTRPPRYTLYAVSQDRGEVEELPCPRESPYRIKNYR